MSGKAQPPVSLSDLLAESEQVCSSVACPRTLGLLRCPLLHRTTPKQSRTHALPGNPISFVGRSFPRDASFPRTMQKRHRLLNASLIVRKDL